jgi:hypothetical protein
MLYTVLLSCLAQSGLEDQAQRALALHKEMSTSLGIPPNELTYMALLDCIMRSKATGKGRIIRDVLTEMEQVNEDMVNKEMIEHILRACPWSNRRSLSQKMESFEVACEVMNISQKSKKIRQEWQMFEYFFQTCHLARHDARAKQAAQAALTYCEKMGWQEKAKRAIERTW